MLEAIVLQFLHMESRKLIPTNITEPPFLCLIKVSYPFCRWVDCFVLLISGLLVVVLLASICTVKLGLEHTDICVHKNGIILKKYIRDI